MLRKGKSIETERLEMPRARGGNAQGFSFWNDGSVQKLNCGDGNDLVNIPKIIIQIK